MHRCKLHDEQNNPNNCMSKILECGNYSFDSTGEKIAVSFAYLNPPTQADFAFYFHN